MNEIIIATPDSDLPCIGCEKTMDSFFWISNRNGHFKLYYTKCRFIETGNRCLIFHYGDQAIRQSGKISEIIEQLPQHIFFRCNNSYIVNLLYINSITPEGDRYSIRLVTGESLPLSRSRYHECLTRLNIQSK